MSPEQALAKRVVDRRPHGCLFARSDPLRAADPATRLRRQGPRRDPPQDRRATSRRRCGSSTPRFPRTWKRSSTRRLAKEPSERYATAQELADDLRYYLEDRPIRARRPSLLDRAAKWGRRHTASVAAASVILVLAMIGLATSTILIAREQRRTSAALEQADARFQLARKAVDEMYTQVAEKWLADQPTLTKLQTEFLEKALAFYEQFAAAPSGKPEVRLAAARASREVGEIRAALGKFDESVAAHRQAIAVCQDLASRLPTEPLYRHELASCLRRFGIVQRKRGRDDEAEPLLRQAFTLWEELSNQHPENVEYQQCLAGTHHALANCDEFWAETSGSRTSSSAGWSSTNPSSRRTRTTSWLEVMITPSTPEAITP